MKPHFEYLYDIYEYDVEDLLSGPTLELHLTSL